MQKKSSMSIWGSFVLFLFPCLVSGQSVDHGNVVGNTYSDARFGLSYTFPAAFDVQSSLNGMPVGTGQKKGTSEFLFSAMEKPTGRVRSGVFITSDPVGVNGFREIQPFLRFVIANGMGVKQPGEFIKATIARQNFYEGRVDIPGAITIYGAQLATVCNGHFLVFWFSASSHSEVEALVHSLDGMTLSCSLSAK